MESSLWYPSWPIASSSGFLEKLKLNLINENRVIPQSVDAIRACFKKWLSQVTGGKSTYTWISLSKTFEESEMEWSDSGLAGLLLVVVEPKVVCTVAAQVVRFSVKVQIPHIILLLTMALEKLKSLSEQDLLEFTDDSIKYLSGASIPFLSKYRERFGDSLLIVPCRTLIIDLL